MLTEILAGQFEFEQEIADQATYQPAKRHRKKRVIEALRSRNSADADALALKIEGCGRGNLCSSPWCRTCQSRAAYGLQSRIKEYVDSEFGGDHELANSRLVFVTPLFDLVSLHDPKQVRSTIGAARKLLKAFKKAFPRLWWQGAFELELIDFKLLMRETGVNQIKRDTIAKMLGWQGESLSLYTPLVLVHAHILVDLNGEDRGSVRSWLAAHFDKADRQVDLRSITQGQPLSEMCSKIGKYPFKDRVQFNMTFDAKGYEGGTYFSDQNLARLVLLYDQIGKNGLKNLLISSASKVVTAP